LLLPLKGNDGNPFGKAKFDAVRSELVEQFGGVTAYVRSPPVGAWEDGDGAVCRDDVILFEVMIETLDRGWWAALKMRVEFSFHQESILVRVSKVHVL
jgi:hypothetical protein